MNIREQFEKREANFLSPFGCQSAHSRGRMNPEEACPIRTAFQVDRDRIVYANAFRRLKHKTQVFLAPLGEQYRTRLTHTLEVAQIGRTLARALGVPLAAANKERLTEEKVAVEAIIGDVRGKDVGNGTVFEYHMHE